MSENQANVVITRSTKSQGIGLILTFLFGSLGLFYASVIGGIIMLIVEVVVAIVTFGIGLIVTHIVCLIWSMIAVSNYNKNLLAGKN